MLLCEKAQSSNASVEPQDIPLPPSRPPSSSSLKNLGSQQSLSTPTGNTEPPINSATGTPPEQTGVIEQEGTNELTGNAKVSQLY